MDKPQKPDVVLPSSFGGIKEPFSTDRIKNGFEVDIPQIFEGSNINDWLDKTGKKFEYVEKITDFVNNLPINNIISTDNNNKLVYIDKEETDFSRNIGEIVPSTIPLTDAGLHLMDGSLIQYGSYSAFIDHMARLYETDPHLFCTEAEWQESVTKYGVCGKYVYDSNAKTIRLPKVTGFIQGTLDPAALGEVVEAGLPDITGKFTGLDYGNTTGQTEGTNGAFNVNSKMAGTTTASVYTVAFNEFKASRSNPIYSKHSTVQPQAINGYLYIVIATSTKTDIQVNIDEIVTDLNSKADKDLKNITTTGKELITSLGIPDYKTATHTTFDTWHTVQADSLVTASAQAQTTTQAYVYIHVKDEEGNFLPGIVSIWDTLPDSQGVIAFNALWITNANYGILVSANAYIPKGYSFKATTLNTQTNEQRQININPLKGAN